MEVEKMKTIIKLLMIVFISSFLVSCELKDRKNEIILEFSQYDRDNNVVLILDNNYLYFNDYTITLSELETKGEYSYSCLIYLNQIYFTTIDENDDCIYDLYIYRCDKNGENIELVFSQKFTNYRPQVKSTIKYFFWIYYDSGVKSSNNQAIDSFDVSTSEHKNIEKGTQCNLNNYSNGVDDYLTNLKNNSFQIYKYNSNIHYIVDDDLLRRSGYYESLHLFNFRPIGLQVFNGKLFLRYSLKRTDTGFDLCYAIFEYNTNNNTLLFRSLVFPGDIEYIYICEFIEE